MNGMGDWSTSLHWNRVRDEALDSERVELHCVVHGATVLVPWEDADQEDPDQYVCFACWQEVRARQARDQRIAARKVS